MGHESFLIAVVDDDADVRLAIERLLCASGFATVAFGSGEVFLDSLESRLPDCVVLDLHMPGLSGFEVQVRLLETYGAIPVILVTCHDTAESRSRASRSSAKAYLCKPVDQETLLNAIQAAVIHREGESA